MRTINHAHATRRALITASAALSAAASIPAAHAQVLEINTGSLTTYLPSATTGIQDIRPIWLQRGTHPDGSLRAGPGYAWPIAANPAAEGLAGGRRLGDIDLPTGTFGPTYICLARRNLCAI